MKKLIAAALTCLVIGFAVALAGADDSSDAIASDSAILRGIAQ